MSSLSEQFRAWLNDQYIDKYQEMLDEYMDDEDLQFEFLSSCGLPHNTDIFSSSDNQ